jgi:hypothetical protein
LGRIRPFVVVREGLVDERGNIETDAVALAAERRLADTVFRLLNV